MVEYGPMAEGVFLSRPNRFVAMVELDGQAVRCHVKNTGRCRELLVPGARVWCQPSQGAGRKTAWSLITVEKQGRLVNLDSQVPNALAAQWVQAGGLGAVPTALRREFTLGDSRFDLQFILEGQPCLMEVKGVTLETNGLARFPDAPTERGRKHLRGLMAAAQDGWRTWVLFVVQMDGVTAFAPNWATDPAFAQTLVQAQEAGVQLLARTCHVAPDHLEIADPLPIDLSPTANLDGPSSNLSVDNNSTL